MNDKEERVYEEGRRSAIRFLLGQLVSELAPDDKWPAATNLQIARLVVERDETRARLRGLCEALECDDWPDGLYLPDVIDKYLVPALEEEAARLRGLGIDADLAER